MSGSTVDVMIDLETLGTDPGSVILSIGAICVPGPEVDRYEQFYTRIDPLDALYRGLSIDPKTVEWWRNQSQTAWRASVLGGGSLEGALDAFSLWLEKLRAGQESAATGVSLRLWGDSAAFDLGLLKAAYKVSGLPVPWHYREEYCYRTLRQLKNSDKPKAKLQHDALSDAKAQLEHLRELLEAP